MTAVWTGLTRHHGHERFRTARPAQRSPHRQDSLNPERALRNGQNPCFLLLKIGLKETADDPGNGIRHFSRSLAFKSIQP